MDLASNHGLKKIYDSIKKAKKITGLLDLSSMHRMFEFKRANIPLKDQDELLRILGKNSHLLSEVRELYLRDNGLLEIPAFVFGMYRLEKLDLYGNNIIKIPKEIEELVLLKNLNISNNRLTELPSEILFLSSLKTLSIYGNNLTELPQKIHRLANLETLIAYKNKLKSIPDNIIRMEKLTAIQLNDNPIANVPLAIYTQSNPLEALKQYYRSQNEEETEEYFEGKIIVLGNGEVGKTTLVDNLVEPRARENHPSTVGLEVLPWEFYSKKYQRNFRFKIWDFGGQGKYRTVQQLFCTPNAIYIYVTTPDQRLVEEKYGSYTYWLNFVNVTSDKCPVIFVLNKADDDSCNYSLDEISIKQRFPEIQSFLRTSYKKVGSSKGATEGIKRAIEDCIDLGPRPGVQDFRVHPERINKDWQVVMDYLNELRSERHYISRQEFSQICHERDVDIDSEIDTFLNYLNKIGFFLIYEKEGKNKLFRFDIILNPNWIRESVYNVIDYLERQKRSYYMEKDLPFIWKNYYEQPEIYEEVELLMGDLNFTFQINDRHYLPSLLPTYHEGAELTEEATLPEPFYRLRFTFEPYIPAGLLHKIIANNIYQLELLGEFYENRFFVFWAPSGTRVEITEDWKMGQLHLALSDDDLWFARFFEYEIKRAMHEFEGRNYISEINVDAEIIYDGTTKRLQEINAHASVKSIYDYRSIQVAIAQADGVNFAQNGVLDLPLQQYSVAENTEIVFRGFGERDDVSLKNIWTGKTGQLVMQSTALHYNGLAGMVTHNSWTQLHYQRDANGLTAITILLNKLTGYPERTKFVALPAELWPLVKRKWPSLEFHEHDEICLPALTGYQPIHMADELSVNDVRVILNHLNYYKEYGGEEYLKYRILKGAGLGIRIADNLVAWAILHEDGTIGGLRVLEKFRRQGLASDLLLQFTNKLKKSSRKAIVHVSRQNEGAKKLMEVIGGEVQGAVAWARIPTQEQYERILTGDF